MFTAKEVWVYQIEREGLLYEYCSCITGLYDDIRTQRWNDDYHIDFFNHTYLSGNFDTANTSTTV